MARCEVSIVHTRIRKNFFLEDAKDEADAIRKFHRAVDLPALPEGETWPIKVDWLGALDPNSKPSALESLPKSAAEAMEKAVEKSSTPATPSPAPVSEMPQQLDALKAFGLDDRQVEGLRKANLTTVVAIKGYAQGGGQFGDLLDLKNSDEPQIKKAVQAAQHGK